MTIESHKQLDLADTEYKSIKKIFDLNSSSNDYQARKKTATNFRKTIEEKDHLKKLVNPSSRP